jgi:hypothetical protein
VDEDCTGFRDEVFTALARPLVANLDLGMVVVRALRTVTANALAPRGGQAQVLQVGAGEAMACPMPKWVLP